MSSNVGFVRLVLLFLSFLNVLMTTSVIPRVPQTEHNATVLFKLLANERLTQASRDIAIDLQTVTHLPPAHGRKSKTTW